MTNEDLRDRIADAIADQHRQGALVGAEADAVMAVLDAAALTGWLRHTAGGHWWVSPGRPTDQRVMVLPGATQ